MNCAESHDLLLDLAYGELPPARAAEVETHVAGCAACRAEKKSLDEARRIASPLRELEEPSAEFDEPIMRAARAEAGMQADGTPGPVVEVAATVKPLGLSAARLDPHAPVRRGTGQGRPRWARRVAVVGSVAAAASLAVVVGSSLTSREKPVREEVSPIRVRAPSGPVVGAVEEALPKSKDAAGGWAGDAPARRAAPAVEAPTKNTSKAKLAKSAAGKADAADETQPVSRPQKKELAAERLGEPPATRGEVKVAEAPRPAEPRAEAVVAAKEAPVPAQPSARGALQTAPVAVPSGAAAAGTSGAPRTADQLEDEAGAARRRGEYARAASLYRDASALRRASEPARAAWSLAHAVECLAAGGRIAEAIASRKDLIASFPDQAGPRAAADSALRSVRLPLDDEKPASSQ
jgi:Putative zinc-finger